MATAIVVPDFGSAIESLKLINWLKQKDDSVKQGEVICEVETDKSVVDIESTADGVLLSQVVAEGSEISSQEIIAYVGKPGEQI